MLEYHMNNKLASLVATSALFFAACGDSGSDSPATRKELCAKAPKLTEGCLVGTWDLTEVARFSVADGSPAGSEVLSGQASLKITDNGQFEYHASAGNVYNGTWEISADSSKLLVNKTVGDYSYASFNTAAALDSSTLVFEESVFEEFKSNNYTYKDKFEFAE